MSEVRTNQEQARKDQEQQAGKELLVICYFI